jgi:FG-GAP-like repeat/Putative binding domain, N-terminal
MKKFTKSLLFALCFAALGAIITNAQARNSRPSKNILAEIVREKSQNNKPFVLITPDDLAKISTGEIQSRTAAGDPCDEAAFIAFGQTINGQLASTDCRLPDNSYADFYLFNGTQGQQVTINLSSSVFDAYLAVANESGTFTVEDDDGGGGTNSRIVATLPASGLYAILANSALPNQFGGYSLSLSGGSAPCSYTLTPNFAQIPAQGGTFTFEVTTQSGCQWTASPSHSYITTSSTGNGSGTVTYTVSQNGSGATRNGAITVGGQFFTFSQPSVSCSYSLNPSSVNVPATETVATFQIVAPEGCPWTVQSNSWFVSSTGFGSGTADITYQVVHNNDAPRVGTISVGGQTFTVNQAGLNCTYTVSPTQFTVGLQESIRTVNINTQPGCTWQASRNQFWIELYSLSGTGAGTLTFKVYAQTVPATRSGAIQIWHGSGSTAVWIDQTATAAQRTVFDFDADGKTDIGIFRPSPGEWWINRSSNNQTLTATFGASTDKIVPADFTGDGKADIALFRESTGEWFVLRSENGSFYSFPFGTAGDIPAPADFDGDNKTDAAVFRPSTATWFIRKSSDESVIIQQFGQTGDAPVVADYDGDGKADIAVYRCESAAEWWINKSSGGVFAVQFGGSLAGVFDQAVQGDYTGDGKTDVAIFRPWTGEWFILRSENQSYYSFPFGTVDDIPSVGDYDGDGKFDAAIFRPSNQTWYVQRTTAGTLIQSFGQYGDKPVSNAFIP